MDPLQDCAERAPVRLRCGPHEVETMAQLDTPETSNMFCSGVSTFIESMVPTAYSGLRDRHEILARGTVLQ